MLTVLGQLIQKTDGRRGMMVFSAGILIAAGGILFVAVLLVVLFNR